MSIVSRVGGQVSLLAETNCSLWSVRKFCIMSKNTYQIEKHNFLKFGPTTFLTHFKFTEYITNKYSKQNTLRFPRQPLHRMQDNVHWKML